MRRPIAVCFALALLVAACGGSNDETTAGDTPRAGSEGSTPAPQDADALARGFADMARNLNAAMGGDPNRKPVEPLGIRELQGYLPDIEGWERDTPVGERMTAPVTFAQASVTLRNGEQVIEAKIVDSAFNQLLMTPFTMFLAAGYEKDTGTGYEKSVQIGDYPGWEKWDDTSRSGELNAVVNRRFIVQLEGRGLDDSQPLYATMRSPNVMRLAELE